MFSIAPLSTMPLSVDTTDVPSVQSIVFQVREGSGPQFVGIVPRAFVPVTEDLD